MALMQIAFRHGLGDCVNFAHSIPLYLQRGHQVQITCEPDKALLFRLSGAVVQSKLEQVVDLPYYEPLLLGQPRKDFARYNKPAANLGRSPMPALGEIEELWTELVSVRFDCTRLFAESVYEEVNAFLATISRPVVLLHTLGHSIQETKNLAHDLTLDLYRGLLQSMPGTLVLLDWDNRMPRLNSPRVRHLIDHWRCIDLETLIALIAAADLLIGIDSGPFHLARLTETPSIGIFWHPIHHPIRIALPHPQQLCLVPGRWLKAWNELARSRYRIAEWPTPKLTADFIVQQALEVLQDSARAPASS